MLKPKTKGLYIDVSEFSILAVRTSGYKLPIVVEEVAELPIAADCHPDDVRAFLEQLVDFKGASYYVARCGVYPKGRFLRYYEAESAAKVKKPEFLSGILQSEFNVDPVTSSVSILDARDGSDLDIEKGLAKALVFCGAPATAFQEVQDQMLSYGVYPDRLELSSAATLGGVCDYARFNRLDAPIMCVELTSEVANVFIINRGQVDVARPVPFGLDSIYPLLQRELGLKDEASARKLFYSNTFDFAEMGPKLLRRMVKELQATAGFYEVQTGQTIDRVFLGVLPQNLSWIAKTVSDSLGIEILQPNLEAWLEGLNVKLGDGVEIANFGSRWLGVFSLMCEFHLREEVAGE
ncbi:MULTISPECIES: hypothetical protein [unclassified Lentimonas]|uniref:hypothetical protein n=1 Tax=unclassified Lentimonas TaxID=2630993 RepID=UPI00132BB01E|nr:MULTISPECIES: hypothetical protein [unclassified Lentimonas]CAA6691629.1 Unannotated [Lentimonas sp. CC10]CAA6696287.1 Unannotated [Lentimonas sp. CC19]CAA7070838.1 Unannotated [Lentimonas sp. CC11]